MRFGDLFPARRGPFRSHCRRDALLRRRLFVEKLERRQLLATLQILSTPHVSASGWATATSERTTRIQSGTYSFDWFGNVNATPPNFNITSNGNGSASMSGPLTFRVVPIEPSEVGTPIVASVRWDYSVYWDLDPAGSNRVYASASMTQVGKFFDVDWGRGAGQSGLWWTADNSGFPDEADSRQVVLVVGNTYSIQLHGGINAVGLWNGLTDSHGDVGLWTKLGVSIETQDPDVSVSLAGVFGGGATLDYSLSNWGERESTVELYWAKAARTATGLATLGGPIYTVDLANAGDGSHSITIPANDLRQPPKGAQYLVAIADPRKRVTELDESNNWSSIPLLSYVDVDIEFLGPTNSSQSINPFCRECSIPTSNKGEVYRLVANLTNRQSVYPLTVTFDYTETYDGGVSDNLMPALADRKGIKPTTIASGQTIPVILDPIRKTWDWIPPENPFTNPPWGNYFSDRLTEAKELRDLFKDASIKLNGKVGGVLKFAGSLAPVLDVVALAWAASTIDPQVDLRYRVVANTEGLYADSDTATIRIEVTDNLKAKLAGAAVAGVFSNLAKGWAVGAALSSIYTAGAGLGVAALLMAESKILAIESDLFFEQAYDPPDPDYKRLAVPDWPIIDPALVGLEKAISQSSLTREAWMIAESASRDRAFGARAAADPKWFSDQLESSSGFAVAGANLDLQLIMQQSLLLPMAQKLASNPTAIESHIANGFPPELMDFLREKGDMDDSEIEQLRLEMVRSGVRDIFDNSGMIDARRTSALSSLRVSLQELVQAIGERTQSLDATTIEPSERLTGRMVDLRNAIEASKSQLLPSIQMIEQIEEYVSVTHQLAFQTNNWRTYDEPLEYAHAEMEKLLLRDFSPQILVTTLFANQAWMTETAYSELAQSAELLLFYLAETQFESAIQSIDQMKSQIDSLVMSGDLYDSSLAVQISDYLDLLSHSINGESHSLVVTRPASAVRVYQDHASTQIDLNQIVQDRDFGDAVSYRILENSNASLVNAGIRQDSLLELSFVRGQVGRSDLWIQATSADGSKEYFAVPVNVFPSIDTLNILPISNQHVREGEVVEINVDAKKIELNTGVRYPADEILTYSVISDLPGAISIDTNGHFLWITDENLGGQSFTVELLVTQHGQIPVTYPVSFTVTVEDWSRPPVLSPVADQQLLTHVPFEMSVAAIDYDVPTEAITFRLENAPVGMSIHPVTGQLSWIPNSIGVFTFDVLATDSRGLVDRKSVQWQVFSNSFPNRVVDLSVIQMRVEQYEASWGGSVELTTTIANLGTSPSGDFELAWYLMDSTGHVYDNLPLRMAGGEEWMVIDGLASGTTSDPLRLHVKLPQVPPIDNLNSPWRIVARVDPRTLIAETNESNNGQAAVPFVSSDVVYIASADSNLIGISLASNQPSVTWGDSFLLNAEIRNQGELATGAFDVQWYLSTDETGSSEDVLLELVDGSSSIRLDALAAGESSAPFGVQLQLPMHRPEHFSGGNYWIVMKVDSSNMVVETNESDNFAQTIKDSGCLQLVMRQAELIIENYANQENVTWGSTFGLLTTVTNQGDQASGPTNVTWYLTDNPENTDHYYPLIPTNTNAEQVRALGLNEFQTKELTFLLPNQRPPLLLGDQFWVISSVDTMKEVEESNESNNLSPYAPQATLLISLAGDAKPDLIGSFYNISSLNFDGELTVSIAVQNSGLSAADESVIRWYLSEDEVLDTDDLPLRLTSAEDFIKIPSIAAGQGLESPLEFTLKTPPAELRWYGNKVHFIIALDADQDVEERLESNNLVVFPLSAPGTLTDIELGAIIVDLPTAELNQQSLPITEWGTLLRFEQYVFNFANASTPDFELRWYLSRDSQYSEDDIPLSVLDDDHVVVHGLQYGVEYFLQNWLQLPDELPPEWSGNKFNVISIADLSNRVTELRKDNNVSVSEFYIGPHAKPDLRAAYSLVQPDTYQWGDLITIESQVQNVGNSATNRSFNVSWYLSKDEIASADDVLLKLESGSSYWTVEKILDGREYFGTFGFTRYTVSNLFDVQLQLPLQSLGATAGSTYYVLTRIDAENSILESDENNNYGEVGRYVDRAPVVIGGTATWQNSDEPTDVNGDTNVGPIDALLVINLLNRGPRDWIDARGKLLRAREDEKFYDVNGNGVVEPIDALIIINYLNRISGHGESEMIDRIFDSYDDDTLYGPFEEKDELNSLLNSPIANGEWSINKRRRPFYADSANEGQL